MRITLNNLKNLYDEAIDNQDDNLLFQVCEDFWSLKKVNRKFERMVGSENKPKRINPNMFDTADYWHMKPSEQINVEMMFMEDILNFRRINL